MDLTLPGEASAPIVAPRPNARACNVASVSIVPVPVARDEALPWSQLAVTAGSAPFLRPEWIFAYLEIFEPHATLETFAVHRQGEPIGLLPLLRERSWFYGVPTRLLRAPVLRNAPDPFDLVCAVADNDPVAGAAWDALRRRRDWDVIELVDLPEDGAGWQMANLAEAAGYPVGRRSSRRSPFVPIPTVAAGDEPIIAATGTKFRANLRRRMRNLEKAGPVELKRYDHFDSAVFEQFLELEHSGWKGRNGTSILSDPQTVAYFRALALAAARHGYLAIYALECDGEPVAMHFGLTHGRRYMVPKLAFSELHHEYAPGQLLVQEVIRDCAARGFTEFDFLGNAMSWKMEWTDQIREYHRVHIFNRTAAGYFAWRSRYSLLTRAQAIRRRLQSTASTETRLSS
jgi:CelD/BcsL family acetyltransferase involved in cellulose biosynthesis